MRSLPKASPKFKPGDLVKERKRLLPTLILALAKNPEGCRGCGHPHYWVAIRLGEGGIPRPDPLPQYIVCEAVLEEATEDESS